MKLFANGCSMTHGQELVEDAFNPANTELCYAKKIFDKYDTFTEYVNVALPGVSNRHIVESTLDYLITKGTSDTFVLIGWTSPIRYSFTHNDHYIRFNIHTPPHPGEWKAGTQITEFHKQFRLHMNDEHDLARHFWHEVNYVASWLEYAGVPYAMTYFFEEPGYNQSRRRISTLHWSPKSNLFGSFIGNTDKQKGPITNFQKDFGSPKPDYLYRFNILEGSQWYSLQQDEKEKGQVWSSGRHPNELGHECIAERLIPLVDKALNTI